MATSDKFEEALAFAARLHREQPRKATNIPYVTHLMSVSALVGEYGGDEEQMIAGLLHDAVEDQGGRKTLEEIRRRFGDRVAGIVDACTDTDEIPKPPWRARKEKYLAHLANAPSDARLVSAADKVHNLRTILMDLRRVGERVWSRFKAPKADTLWYYRELAREFQLRGPAEFAAELHRLLRDIETFDQKPAEHS
jgi:(p)ppGpp synthase/HD superfamily hydrolase